MIGKYKLIGILVGTAATSYGGYEIYTRFGSSSNVANLDNQHEPEAPNEEDLNRDLLNDAEQPAADIQDNVPVANAEAPKPEKSVEPKQNPIVSPKQPELPRKPISNGLRDHMMNAHLNTDGTIKIVQGTIGSRFQNDIIISKKDDEIWKRQVSAGDDDLKYAKENKGKMRLYRNPIPEEFLLKNGESADAERLQRRCASAYRKKSWQDLSRLKHFHNKYEKIRQYGEIVWKYCGQHNKPTPQGWGKP